jgi:hypothetical protein
MKGVMIEMGFWGGRARKAFFNQQIIDRLFGNLTKNEWLCGSEERNLSYAL